MTLLPGALLPGGLLPTSGSGSVGGLPNIDLPTFVMVDPALNAVVVDDLLAAATVDPAGTGVSVDG